MYFINALREQIFRCIRKDIGSVFTQRKELSFSILREW